MPLDALPCEFLFTLTANTAERPPVVVGSRLVVTAMSGTFEGPKLRGIVADAAGGDWVKIQPDGTLFLDVRIALQTDDGAAIYMAYSGIGQRGADGVTTIRTAPRFEVADDRYAWLNNVQAVAHGKTGKGNVSYDVYALT
jgi:hypothetical protein